MSLSQKDLQVGPFAISGGELLACVIYEAIKCKQWPCLPRRVAALAERIEILVWDEFEKISEDFYLKTFANYEELLTWLQKFILPYPEVQELNLSDAEFEAGLRAKDVDDEKRNGFVFTSAFSKAIPSEHDFVDLDAYIRNLCHDLIRSCIEINFSTFPGARHYNENSVKEIQYGVQD